MAAKLKKPARAPDEETLIHPSPTTICRSALIRRTMDGFPGPVAMAFPSFDLAAGPSPAGSTGSASRASGRADDCPACAAAWRRGSQDVLIHPAPVRAKRSGPCSAFSDCSKKGKLSHLLVFCPIAQFRSPIQCNAGPRARHRTGALGKAEAAELPKGGGLFTHYQGSGAARQLERGYEKEAGPG